MPIFPKEGSNTASMRGSEFYGYGNAASKYASPAKDANISKENRDAGFTNVNIDAAGRKSMTRELTEEEKRKYEESKKQ